MFKLAQKDVSSSISVCEIKQLCVAYDDSVVLDKVSFSIPQQSLCAIVGPNGSDKSNVADAVRWLLGEQSMKNIRSQSSKDLIFSGSKTRSRLGKANVALCFDNQSGCIPLDFSEVVVSRNIFRDGTSEYFVNKSPSKLMDVVEILAKANIGHRGFSVINQGMESEILKYSPSELYELLEEASGVRYLQLKKKRSERRLRTTQTNLEKVSTILTELKPHLRYLKREATKVEKKEKLKKKLVQLQEQFFFSRIVDLEKQKKDLDREGGDLEIKISKFKKEVFQLNQELQKEEVNIEDGRKKYINAQKELEKLLDERAKLSEQLAHLRAQIQIEKERQPIKEKREINIDAREVEKEFQYVHQTLKKILKSEDLNEVKNGIDKIVTRVERIIGSQDIMKKIKKADTGQLSKLIEEQKKLEELLVEFNQKYETQRKVLRTNQGQSGQEKFFELERSLRKKKDSLSELGGRFREIKWLTEQLEKNFRELKQDIAREGMDYGDIQTEKNIEQVGEPFEQSENEISRLKYKIEEIGGVDEITLQEYKETRERYDKLSKKLEDLTKAKKNLEDLIKELAKEITGQFGKNFQVINDNFNKYLRLLFGGGRGYLKQITNYKLQITNTNEEEDLSQEEPETSKGIEIKATLPGKKIRDLRMFSGGEKALTSIALLFAIVSSNPPPFLVLDEVDATLDESNSRRFAKLVREFSKDTQFVVITHNRETMNQADVLYGVTMGEDGVSSLLSLKLKK